jgi:hypothetical protein
LTALGITAREPEAALMQIADLFAALPDGLEKTNLAMRLFGKTGADLIPLLNGGSAALREMMETGQALNPVTAELAANAAALNDSLDRLKTSSKGLGTSVGRRHRARPDADHRCDGGSRQGRRLLKTLWVGLGGVGAALFTDDLLSDAQRLAKTTELLYTLRRKGFDEDHRYIIQQKLLIRALQERIEAEEQAQQTADDAARATERRNEVLQAQSARLIQIKEYETEQVKAALDAQAKAYRAATSAIEKTEKDRIALAEKNRQRIADLLAPDVAALDLNAEDDATRFGNQAQARSNLNNLLAQARGAIAAGEFQQAIDLGERAAALITELKAAGAQATSVLAAQLRDVAAIQDQALAGRGEAEKAKAIEAKAVLDTIQKELDALKAIPIGIDLATAENAIVEATARMQKILDANPLLVNIVTRESGGIAGALDDLPAKASGGLLRGPGSGTSDSILARVSNGEYVVRAEAVKRLGLANLHAINQGRLPNLRAAAEKVAASRRLPRFAEGGLIASAVGSLPRLPASSGTAASSVLNLTLPGVGTFETRASEAVAADLQRALRLAAMKNGRRT